MTKVLHSIYSIGASTGGPARSVPALLRGLQNAGVDARLNVCESDQLSTSGFGCWRTATYATALNGWQPDLVHDHGLWLPSNHQAAAYSRKRSSPLVISPRGMLEPWSMNHRRWKKRIAWRLYQGRDLRQAACLHATSIQEAGHFRRLGLMQPIAVLPNGVEVPDTKSSEVRSDDRVRTVLFMSRIHPKKGLPLLVDAWSRLRPAGWRLRIVGPDEAGHAAEIRKAASASGIEKSVTIEPEVDDESKWAIYRDADLFVLPTYSENFGIVVAEALASGVPVITTDGTPWTDLDAWGAGWCVRPEAGPLFDRLKVATELSDSSRQAMGQRGRAIVQEKFSWPALAGQMREVYLWLLGGGSPPACVMINSAAP